MLPMTPALPARGQRGGGTVADEQAQSRGVDRRTVIKRAAAAGAVVSTAPVIIDSLASPAAALSCLNCFRVQIEVPQFAPCTTTTRPVDSNTCGTVIGPGCTTTPNVVSGVPIDHVCLSSLNCSFQQSPLVFTLDTTSACWDEGSCGAGRQILACARSELAPHWWSSVVHGRHRRPQRHHGHVHCDDAELGRIPARHRLRLQRLAPRESPGKCACAHPVAWSGPPGNRTPDHRIKSPLLCQLS
jgi:hypothetical protein